MGVGVCGCMVRDSGTNLKTVVRGGNGVVVVGGVVRGGCGWVEWGGWGWVGGGGEVCVWEWGGEDGLVVAVVLVW